MNRKKKFSTLPPVSEAVSIDNVTLSTGSDDDLTIIELVWPRVGLTPRELRRTLFDLRVHILSSELHIIGGLLRERLRICDRDGRILRGQRLREVEQRLFGAVRSAQEVVAGYSTTPGRSSSVPIWPS